MNKTTKSIYVYELSWNVLSCYESYTYSVGDMKQIYATRPLNIIYNTLVYKTSETKYHSEQKLNLKRHMIIGAVCTVLSEPNFFYSHA